MGIPFKKILGIVGSIAPTIASAVGTPIAGLAVNTVLNALGVKSENEAEEMLRSNPDALLKLKQAEAGFKVKMEELGIDLEAIHQKDRDSARQREMAVKDKTPSILAYVYTAGYFFILGWILKMGIPESTKEIIMVLMGILSTAEVGIIQYYFGSSAGSKQKSDAISGIINNR
ncbi:MAG: hypothetical protein V3U97_05460 [bacterium]